MEVGRFLEAAQLLATNGVILKTKARKAWYFEVRGREKLQYGVTISEDKCLCTCEHGSLHGVNKALPCKHVIASLAACVRLWGPVLRERWTDPAVKLKDWYDALNDEEQERFKEMTK